MKIAIIIGAVLLFGFFIAGAVSPLPTAAAQAQHVVVPQPKPEGADEPPLRDHKWNSTWEGHYVDCEISEGHSSFIVMPTQDESIAGVGPKINNAPTLSEWASVCPPPD